MQGNRTTQAERYSKCQDGHLPATTATTSPGVRSADGTSSLANLRLEAERVAPGIKQRTTLP